MIFNENFTSKIRDGTKRALRLKSAKKMRTDSFMTNSANTKLPSLYIFQPDLYNYTYNIYHIMYIYSYI